MEENKKPLIKIEYKDTIPAKDLANYFMGLNNEFKSFLKENKYDDLISNELKIQEIKQGSIEIYPFLEYAAAALPLIDQLQLFIDFFTHIGSFLDLLKKDDPKIDCSQKKLANYKGINGVNVSADNVTINYLVINPSKPNETQQIATITSSDSKLIDKNIKKRLMVSKNIDETSKKAALFFWDSAKFDISKPYNYKGVCKEISNASYHVCFENETIENYMTKQSHLSRPWQDLCYVVDAELREGKNSPVLKITKVYEDQTFYEEDTKKRK